MAMFRRPCVSLRPRRVAFATAATCLAVQVWSIPRSAVERRQMRSGLLDLRLVHRRGDSGHGAGWQRLGPRAGLEFMEAIDDVLRRLAGEQ